LAAKAIARNYEEGVEPTNKEEMQALENEVRDRHAQMDNGEVET
jgi:hypothetical protein